MILIFSASRFSSLLTRFSSAVLLRLSLSICSFKNRTSWSFMSLFLAMSLTLRLKSLASLILLFKIFWISLILPSSARLFLLSSSNSCLSSSIALSCCYLTFLLPSSCLAFSSRIPCNFLITASSDMLLFLSFSISALMRFNSLSSYDFFFVSSFKKYTFSLRTRSSYRHFCSSAMLFLLSLSSYC